MFIGFYKKKYFLLKSVFKAKKTRHRNSGQNIFFSWWSWCRSVSKEGRDGSPAESEMQQEIELNSDTNMMKEYQIIWFWPIEGDFDHFLGPGSNFLLDIKIFDSSFDLRVLGTFWIRNFGQNLIKFNSTLTRRSKIAKRKYLNTFHYFW